MAVVNSVYIFRDLVDLSKLQEIYPEKNRAKMFTHRPECPADNLLSEWCFRILISKVNTCYTPHNTYYKWPTILDNIN